LFLLLYSWCMTPWLDIYYVRGVHELVVRGYGTPLTSLVSGFGFNHHHRPLGMWVEAEEERGRENLKPYPPSRRNCFPLHICPSSTT
jgi:hypothetical protein